MSKRIRYLGPRNNKLETYLTDSVNNDLKNLSKVSGYSASTLNHMILFHFLSVMYGLAYRVTRGADFESELNATPAPIRQSIINWAPAVMHLINMRKISEQLCEADNATWETFH